MNDVIINVEALRRLLDAIGGDPEDLDELFEDYRSEAPDLAAQISGAAAAGDIEMLRIAAHTLKSNARDFGAMQLSALCEDLEHECRTGAVANPLGMAEAIAAAEIAARQALGDISADDLV
jgi:HPt (histidine-containing phosphotransfer) domain-containing protein